MWWLADWRRFIRYGDGNGEFFVGVEWDGEAGSCSLVGGWYEGSYVSFLIGEDVMVRANN